VKSKISPYYRLKYERISKRRGKKRAIIAIARMILTAIYHMFVTGEEFNPSDLYKAVLTPLKKQAVPEGLKDLERYISENLEPINILDMLADTEYW